MEFIVVIAVLILAWLIWQLFKAKQYTRFKALIETELKPKVIAKIIEDLNENRSELFPNNAIHEQAALYYWTQYKSRILKAALIHEIIDEEWLNSIITWELSEGNSGKTPLSFKHEGLRPSGICYDVCANAWDFYLAKSLKNYLTQALMLVQKL